METNGAADAVVRQPLFDHRQQVFGYEIRGEGHVAADSVQRVAGSALAFVRISREALVAGEVGTLPPGQVVLQLDGDIDPTPDVRSACGDMRRRGFRIALDRFRPAEDTSPLLRYVDFLTAEVPVVAALTRRPPASIRAMRPPSIVAVDVDSPDAFDEARTAGSDAFQGAFITRPRLTATSNIPACRVTYLRLLSALQDPDLSILELEELVKPDAALCLRVMRAVNSAAFAQDRRITSLRQALLLTGVNTIREWATLAAMNQLAQDTPRELIAMASIRGRFCELMTKGSIASTGGDGFLLGMCSLLGAILESPMDAVLKHLPLCESNDAALRGEANTQRALLDTTIAWELGQWEQSRRLAASAGFDPALLPGAYNGAMSWMARFQELAGAAA